MVDNDHSTEDCKSQKIIIGAIMKNSEMLMFVADHLKTEKMYKHAVTKLFMLYDIFLINIRLHQCVIKQF